MTVVGVGEEPDELLVPEPCGAVGLGGGVGSLLSQEGRRKRIAAKSIAAAQAVKVFFMDG